MIYLDNAATSYPKPTPVRRAMADALTRYGGNPGRGGHRLALRAAELVYECRSELCRFFGAGEPESIIFTSGATMALNLAILTRVRRGMHVLISDREHNAVLRPILRLASEGIIEYDVYPTAGDVVAAIRERLRPNTGLLVACHVSNVTGYTLPLREIGDLCRLFGIYFVIDAAQSAGHLPFSLAATPCDAFCAPAHKGLLGAAGAGFVILRSADGLRPFLMGGSGVDSLSPEMPQVLPERYEAGTLPTPAIAALLAGVRYLDGYGIERVAAEESAIRRRILEGLSVTPGITLYEPECNGGLIAFTHESIRPELLSRRLDARGVAVRAGYHCAPLAHRTIGTPTGGCVRISVGIGNRPEDAERCLLAIREALNEP